LTDISVRSRAHIRVMCASRCMYYRESAGRTFAMQVVQRSAA
jgi:hypothetical protein